MSRWKWRLYCILLSLLASGIVMPFVFFILADRISFSEYDVDEQGWALYRPEKEADSSDPLLRQRVHGLSTRKALDFKGVEELQSQVKELEAITLSVRNELRELWNRRTELKKDCEEQEKLLAKLKQETNSVRLELQNAKSKLTKTQKEVDANSNCGGGNPLKRNTHDPHQIVILPPREDTLEIPAQQGVVPPPQQQIHKHQSFPSRNEMSSYVTGCSYSLCFDYSKCPLTNPFKAFVYSLTDEQESSKREHSPSLKTATADLVKSLKETDSLTSKPKDACVFVLLMDDSSSMERLSSLSHWGSNGLNHLIVRLPSSPPPPPPSSHAQLVVVGGAIIATATLNDAHHRYRAGFDTPLPPLPEGPSLAMAAVPPSKAKDGGGGGGGSEKKELPFLLPESRSVFLHFEGSLKAVNSAPVSSDAAASDTLDQRNPDTDLNQQQQQHKRKRRSVVSAQDIEYLASALSDIDEVVRLHTVCGAGTATEIAGTQDDGCEWSLCGSVKERHALLKGSMFSLVPGGCVGGGGVTEVTYTRLMESLRAEAIPVVIGINELPFDSVIDWSRAAVILPGGRFSDVHLVLRSLEPNQVMEMRRQARFLYQTYFSSNQQVFKTLFAIVRAVAKHPPPPASDYQASVLVSVPGTLRGLPAPRFQRNFSVYTPELWNAPPGPFYMYPLDPFSPVPLSGKDYFDMEDSRIPNLPLHVIQAGGFFGPAFARHLMGNHPEERYTVVMLTYHRNEVLVEAIERLRDLPDLDKVVVVWNNPEPPPEDMVWPQGMDASLEVVSVGVNSLNNRFLPLQSIETEAVLSIDDDVHLRKDEIQFAFRIWRENRDRIVGFPGRFHAWDVRHGGWLYNSNYTCEISMVLTGAAFFHKYYSYLYTYWMPEELRREVDKYTNCEDLAMNFMVSHITRKPPVKVTSRWTFRCPGCPDNLSKDLQHFEERHVCMNHFTASFGYMPLLYTQFRADSVLFKTRLPSHFEKCYEFI